MELPAGGLSDGVVVVSPYRIEDAELLLAGAQDAEVTRFAGVGWASDTVEELRTRIAETWPALAEENRSLNAAIRDASDERLGHFVVFAVHVRERRLEFGFWLRREARGRAAARRAIELVCAWAFETFDSGSRRTSSRA